MSRYKHIRGNKYIGEYVHGKGKSSDRFYAATAIKILNQNLLAFCNGDATSKNYTY